MPWPRDRPPETQHYAKRANASEIAKTTSQVGDTGKSPTFIGVQCPRIVPCNASATQCYTRRPMFSMIFVFSKVPAMGLILLQLFGIDL